jgi:hypothetical protein
MSRMPQPTTALCVWPLGKDLPAAKDTGSGKVGRARLTADLINTLIKDPPTPVAITNTNSRARRFQPATR